MTQDDIHSFLKSKMAEAGFLSAEAAEAEGWTSECHTAWQSYAYHKLGASAFNHVPSNEAALAELFPEDAPNPEADAKAAEAARAAAEAQAAADAKAAKAAAEAAAAKAAKDAAEAKAAKDAAEAAAKEAAAKAAPAPAPAPAPAADTGTGSK